MAAILSGLWAKSSMTVTPLCVPTTSSRRRMPAKVVSAATAASTDTPSALTAPSAASALATLCAPGTFSTTARGASPRTRSSKAMPVGRGARSCADRSASSSPKAKVIALPGASSCASAAVSGLSRFSTAVCARPTKPPNRSRNSSIDLWSSEMLETTATVAS
ncbi:hypothetical protein D3C85_1313010 [compost metagenome]